MSDSDKYTQNLIVHPQRKATVVDPETEEAFEESKELVKESVHKAATVNVAFLTWLGIFCYRLGKHVWASMIHRLFGKKQVATDSFSKKNFSKGPESSASQGTQIRDRHSKKSETH